MSFLKATTDLLRNKTFATGEKSNELPARDCRPILSKNDYLAFLERERYKADRSGSIFSLIIFPSVDRLKTQLQQCLDIFIGTLRITDEIGWTGNNEIGLFLYETTKDGAAHFINRLQIDAFKSVSIDSHRVYSYPEEADVIYLEKELQRQKRRLELDLSASIYWNHNEDGNPVSLKVATKNISGKGVFLFTDNTLPVNVGKTVFLDILIPLKYLKGLGTETVKIKAQGKVIRKEEKGIAVSFDRSYVTMPMVVSQSSTINDAHDHQLPNRSH